MTAPNPHPIYDEVAEEQRTRTGAFAAFALEEPAPLPEEPADVESAGEDTAEQPAAGPVTEPLEEQAPRRAGAPRSQR